MSNIKDENGNIIDEETGEVIEESNEIQEELGPAENDTIDIIKNLEILNKTKELNEELNNDNTDIVSNPMLDESDKYTTGLTTEEITEFYEYLAGRASRPAFADKFFADGDSRIKESNQLTVMLSLSFIPKLLSLQQAIIDKIAKPETLAYKSVDELTSLLQSINTIITKANENAMKYSKLAQDFTNVPIIQRQIMDTILQVPYEKLPRMKIISKIQDISDETFDRIEEIIDLDLNGK